MLVVISDLHFIDSTAGKHNINSEWFKNVFENFIPELARGKQAKELKVLLMGDIVDLIRTEKWLEAPRSVRPWGEEGRSDVNNAGSDLSGSKTQELCLDILGDSEDLEETGDHEKKTIFARNWKTFDLFKNRFAHRVREEMQDDDFKVEVIYLPGNHDRLCNLYPGVRNTLRDALGLTINESTVLGDPTGEDWWYLPYFKDEAYGVYARHGHEYDIYNYGGGNDLTRTGQLQVSIGDAIATEFAVKVPWLVREYVKKDPSIPNPERLIERLQEADNVRPLGSVVEWFYYSIKDRNTGNVRKALKDALQKTVEQMLDIELVQEWRSPETHADEVIRAAASPWLRWLPSTALRIFEAEDLLSLFGGRESTRDAHAEAAYNKETAWKQEEDIRYVLYGHTHGPVIHPLEVSRNREVVYINTGTWRNRILKTVPANADPQFYLLDQITYLVFYREDEDTEEKQPGTLSYDMWTGSGKKILA